MFVGLTARGDAGEREVNIGTDEVVVGNVGQFGISIVADAYGRVVLAAPDDARASGDAATREFVGHRCVALNTHDDGRHVGRQGIVERQVGRAPVGAFSVVLIGVRRELREFNGFDCPCRPICSSCRISPTNHIICSRIRVGV